MSMNIEQLKAEGIFADQEKTYKFILDILEENKKLKLEKEILSQKLKCKDEAILHYVEASRRMQMAADLNLQAERLNRMLLPLSETEYNPSYGRFVQPEMIYADIPFNPHVTTEARQASADKFSEYSSGSGSASSTLEKMEVRFENSEKLSRPQLPPRGKSSLLNRIKSQSVNDMASASHLSSTNSESKRTLKNLFKPRKMNSKSGTKF